MKAHTLLSVTGCKWSKCSRRFRGRENENRRQRLGKRLRCWRETPSLSRGLRFWTALDALVRRLDEPYRYGLTVPSASIGPRPLEVQINRSDAEPKVQHLLAA